MFKVYSDFKAIAFVSEAPSDSRFVYRPAENNDLEPANLLQKVENNNTLWVVSRDPARTFADFERMFRVVRAAGGVVSDPLGRILMIYRNGVWDLPKGHVEAGETVEAGAVREVGEECGIRVDNVAGFLTDTCHFYRLNGGWELKRCSWYDMRCGGRQLPVPQTREGITAAKWLKGTELCKAASQSYSTIKDVLHIYFSKTDE